MSAIFSSDRLRWLLIASIVLLLFLMGQYDERVFALLTRGWLAVFQALGLDGVLQRVQQGISGQVTGRSLPAVVSYSLVYTSACLLLLWLVLRTPARLRMALLLYGLVFCACLVLLLGGKLAGDVQWSYRLGRRLIDFIVSPLPVLVLGPLLWSYGPPDAPPTLPLPPNEPAL
ncbi:XrtX-associated membrane protein [Hymenobacter koreensis]|uniref:Exosortase F system-associated protein n=1 Tax=Hymenobacter koreensis TaxID=1084523 RepID=A0ABP8IZU4_9BACT